MGPDIMNINYSSATRPNLVTTNFCCHLARLSFPISKSLFILPRLPSLFLITMAAAVEEIRATSYVGFDSITQQIEHKLLKRGFQFNVIVVGAFCRRLFMY